MRHTTGARHVWRAGGCAPRGGRGDPPGAAPRALGARARACEARRGRFAVRRAFLGCAIGDVARGRASPAPRAGGAPSLRRRRARRGPGPRGARRAQRPASRRRRALDARARRARGRGSARAPARRLRDAEDRLVARVRRLELAGDPFASGRARRDARVAAVPGAHGRRRGGSKRVRTRVLRVASRRDEDGRRGRARETRGGVVAAGRRPVRRRAEFRTGTRPRTRPVRFHARCDLTACVSRVSRRRRMDDA